MTKATTTGAVITESPDLRLIYILDDVRMYEVACRTDLGFKDDFTTAARDRRRKLRAEGKSDEEEQRWDITIRVSPKRIECRARVVVQLRDCRYLVDGASIYLNPSADSTPQESALVQFVEQEALPTLYPYLRAEIHQAAAKIRGSRRVFAD